MKKQLLKLVLLVILTNINVALAEPSGLSEDCKKVYRDYEASKPPKAFAKGETRACGWSRGDGNFNQAIKRATSFCVAYGGDNCKVVEKER